MQCLNLQVLYCIVLSQCIEHEIVWKHEIFLQFLILCRLYKIHVLKNLLKHKTLRSYYESYLCINDPSQILTIFGGAEIFRIYPYLSLNKEKCSSLIGI